MAKSVKKMINKPTKKPLLVVIYPYKFTDFVYRLMELGYFERYCDVIVWDISPITTPNLSKAVSAESSKNNNVIILSSLRDFFRCLSELKKRSTEANICIVNEVTNSSFFEFICNWIITAFLRTKNIAVLDLYNGGVPLRFPGRAAGSSLGFFARGLRFVKNTSTLSEAKHKISSLLFGWLASFLPSATTHRLIAGEDWLLLAKSIDVERNKIRLVYGHSYDYSNNLLHKLKSSSLTSVRSQNSIAVLLDGAGPMFASDSALSGRKVHFTTDVWYPALCRFFDRLEAETGVQTEIAGHYKSVHPPIAPCFGSRPVYYGKTIELVRNCEFVITRTSTAISHAVMFRKPVIFIYSNQLKEDREAMRDIRGMAAMLGNEPVNVDGPPFEISDLLKVNDEQYLNYEKACLTSAGSQRPNVQIILEDILNIDTGAEFYKEVR